MSPFFVENISSWLTSSARLGSEGQLSEFIEGLGPGQLVGRQVLASPALGEIQLSLCDRRGHLEVEVIRARGLQCKPGSKVLPGNLRNHDLQFFPSKNCKAFRAHRGSVRQNESTEMTFYRNENFFYVNHIYSEKLFLRGLIYVYQS